MWAVFAAHIVARLAYVGYVWVALTRQQSDGWWTRQRGLEQGFARFRRGASLVMTIDAVSFVAVCLVGWGTLPAIVPRATHLFEEPGALEKVANMAADWFGDWFRPH